MIGFIVIGLAAALLANWVSENKLSACILTVGIYKFLYFVYVTIFYWDDIEEKLLEDDKDNDFR